MSILGKAVYLAGPMTGYPDYNFPAFEEARKQLRRLGAEVICPAEAGQVEGWEWKDYMKRDILMMLDADSVVVLPGWEQSRGAKMEVGIAAKLRMTVLSLHEAIEELSQESSV